MKKIIKYLIVLLVAAAIILMVIQTYRTAKEKKRVEAAVQQLPHCCLPQLNGVEVCTDEFDIARPTVIIYFHPECEHCQYEAEEIGRNYQHFSLANMVLVTPDDSLERINQFAERYNLWSVDNLVILLDHDGDFKQNFGSAIFPSVYIYGTDNKLIKTYKGETKPEAITKYLNQFKF